MKKVVFWGVGMAVLLLMSGVGFAAETSAENATDKTLAVAEVKDADKDAFKEDDLIVPIAKPAPIATVSHSDQTETEATHVKVDTLQAVAVPTKASSGEKSTKREVKAETSSGLNSQEMRQRWKALFSKEITPDSMAYTVKPGDSLYVIARKNHTTVDFIKKLNDLKGDNVYPKMKLKIHTEPFSIVVDKSKNTLVLYSGDEPVKKYSVATGKKNCTPVGEFKITDKLLNPTWFKTGAILPPGSPKNGLGTRWMGFDKPSYGIHGTIEPKSIGTQASEGCVRMLNEEVEELYSLVPVGTKITIQD